MALAYTSGLARNQLFIAVQSSVVPNETKYTVLAIIFIFTSDLTFKEARPRFTLCDKSFLFIFLFVLCSQSLGLDQRCSGERFLAYTSSSQSLPTLSHIDHFS